MCWNLTRWRVGSILVFGMPWGPACGNVATWQPATDRIPTNPPATRKTPKPQHRPRVEPCRPTQPHGSARRRVSWRRARLCSYPCSRQRGPLVATWQPGISGCPLCPPLMCLSDEPLTCLGTGEEFCDTVKRPRVKSAVSGTTTWVFGAFFAIFCGRFTVLHN